MSTAYPVGKIKQVDVLGGSSVPIGCYLKDGVIKPGLNAVNTNSAAKPGLLCLGYSDESGMALACTSEEVYAGNYTAANNLTQIYSRFATSPFYLNFTKNSKRQSALVLDDCYIYMNNGAYGAFDFPASLGCGAMHSGRLFGADLKNGYLLKWSGAGGITDWAEGIDGSGSMLLDPDGGEICAVYDYENELLVLRRNSVMRFEAGGSPEDFRVKARVATPPVAKKSSAAVNGAIYYCSSQGLFRYRGGKAERVEGLFTDDMYNAQYATSYQQRYYIVSADSKSLNRTVVYVYDTVEDTQQIIDVPAYFVGCDAESPLAYTSTAIYRLQIKNAYTVTFGKFDFGSSERKLLTVLEVDCDGDVTVRISNGRYAKTITEPNGRTRLNMRGARFEVTFTGTGTVRSAKLMAEVR